MSATAAPATAASPATMATTPKITGPCIVATAPTTTSMMPRNQAAPAEKARPRPGAFIVPNDGNRQSAPLSSRSIRSSWCCSSSAQAVPSVSSVLDPRRRGDESALRTDHPPRAGPDRPGPCPVPYPVVAQQTTTRTRRDRCHEHRTIVGTQRTRRVPCGRKKNIKIPGLPLHLEDWAGTVSIPWSPRRWTFGERFTTAENRNGSGHREVTFSCISRRSPKPGTGPAGEPGGDLHHHPGHQGTAGNGRHHRLTMPIVVSGAVVGALGGSG